jgi:hypothetical protein
MVKLEMMKPDGSAPEEGQEPTGRGMKIRKRENKSGGALVVLLSGR